jgi:hypothetical protein
MTAHGLPRSRQDLIVKELDKELLIYDEQSKKAYCLNDSSAVIWKMCDGKTTIAELATKVQHELNFCVDEAFVTFALGQMHKDGLLESGFVETAKAAVTRSQLIARLGQAGLVAAAAVPLVTAIMTPTAAKAYNSRPGPGCVLFATPILAADGRVIAARDVVQGDMLIGVNAESGQAVPGTVRRVVEFSAAGFFTFVAQNGGVVSCSASHPLIKGLGDIDGTQAEALRVGDALLVHDSSSSKMIESPIVSVSFTQVPQPVLLFEMDSAEHTYVTGGIASHNKR